MTERMTPSRVLEEYNIVGRRIPKKLIAEMREKFRALEENGEHVWKILCDEVVLPEERDELEDVVKRIAEDRLWVVQGCSEAMLTKSGHRTTLDGVTWSKRVAAHDTPQCFHRFFTVLGLNEIEWQNAGWLEKNGFQSLYRAITDDPRFQTWKSFLSFMGIEKEDSWVERVQLCKTKMQFLLLFRDAGIPGTEWRSTDWLGSNNYRGLYVAIIKDPRFQTWKSFLSFMGIEKEDSWVERVQLCKTKMQFLLLFRDAGIPVTEWRSTRWLGDSGFRGLYVAIIKDPRFQTWKSFLSFMGIEKEDSWVERVQLCKTKMQFLLLFRDAGIPGTEWQSTDWLQKNRFQGLDQAIRGDFRFQTWKNFLACMDGHLPFNGFESPEQAQQCLAEEILRLRSSKKWIQEPRADTTITQAEWEAIARPEWYKRNPVVKAVADYLKTANSP